MAKPINEIIRNTLDNYIICESINEMIDESLGIAQNVENTVYSILNTIKEQLPTKPMIRYDNLGLRLKELYFEQKLSNTNINISLYILYFKSKEDYYSKQKTVDSYFKNSSDVVNNQITIYYVAINGNLDFSQLASTIQHELKHHYDEIMGMKSPSRDIDNYNIATNALNGECDEIEYAIASIIYYANKYETSAFANGLYAFLIQTADERYQKHETPLSNKDLIDIVKSSEAYQYCIEMDKFVNKLETEKGSKELRNLLEKYQITLEKVKKLANYGKRNGLRQIGRAMMWYKQNQLRNITVTNPKQLSAYYHINPFAKY